MKNLLMISIVLLISCGTILAAQPVEPATDSTKASWDQISKDTAVELISWVKSTKKFISEQSPLVCQEVITWGMASSITGLCIGFVFLVMGLTGTILLVKKHNVWKEQYDNWREFPTKAIITWMITVPSSIAGLTGTLVNLYALLFIIYAPRLYLLEVLSNMAK